MIWQALSRWFKFDSWAGYHYGSSLRNAGIEFDPNIVLQFNELGDALEEGKNHIERQGQGNGFLTDSFYQ